MRRPRRARRRPRWTSSLEPPATGAAALDREPDPASVARTIALRLLTAAPRSRHQLAQALLKRGVEESVATGLLDRFSEVGLVDDAEYARMLVRSRHASRGLARRALTVELSRAGIGSEHASAALESVTAEMEEETARELLRKRWRDDVDPTVQSRRAIAMLARKGYPPGLSRRLIAQMVEYGSDAPEPW
jgi:regulatory protein